MKDVWNLSAATFGDTSRGKDCRGLQQIHRALPQPIDIGVYPPEFRMPENVIFLNAYNLKTR